MQISPKRVTVGAHGKSERRSLHFRQPTIRAKLKRLTSSSSSQAHIHSANVACAEKCHGDEHKSPASQQRHLSLLADGIVKRSFFFPCTHADVQPTPSGACANPASDPEEEEDESEDDLEPIDEFISYIENLYFDQTLTAKHVCVIMHLMQKLGHPEVKAYALKPTSQTGKFQRKLDKALDLRKTDASLYPVNVPLKDIRTGYRACADVLAQPAHEALCLEMEQNVKVLDTWRQSIDDAADWIKQYDQHPLVVNATKEEKMRMLPISIYMDGAEYNKKDGLTVFTVRFSFSRTRHLCWAVRKTNVCDCGCGGWCTLYAFFDFVRWSLEALQAGRWPARGHDGRNLDAARLAKAGTDMKFKAIVIDICGDWKEFSASWGFPAWNSYFPCFCCATDRVQMVDAHAVVRMRQDEEYEEACKHNEIIVVVTSKELQEEIKFALLDDSKAKGRVLSHDIPIAKLLKSDRIEPSAERPDTHAIDVIAEPWKPFILKFWRVRDRKRVIVHHRNPLISMHMHIGYQTFSIDVLHCLHLGVFQAWITRVLHLLFAVDAFETRQTRKAEHLQCCAIELMARLKSWYPRYEKSLSLESRPGVTRINVITSKMLGAGKKDGKIIKFKAAETRHFLPFALELARAFEPLLVTQCDCASLIKAGDMLQSWMSICNQHGRRLPPHVPMELTRIMYDHNIAAAAAGVKMLPKHHQARSILF